MAWVKLDDRAVHHPKFQKAGPRAFELWVAGLCYCNSFLTDGRIPKTALGTLLPTMSEREARKVAARLAANATRPGGAPSWIDLGEEYMVHNYGDFQPSRAATEKDRSDAKERMRRIRSASRSVEPATNGDGTNAEHQENFAVRSLSPSRPVLVKEKTTTAGARAGARELAKFGRTSAEMVERIEAAHRTTHLDLTVRDTLIAQVASAASHEDLERIGVALDEATAGSWDEAVEWLKTYKTGTRTTRGARG